MAGEDCFKKGQRAFDWRRRTESMGILTAVSIFKKSWCSLRVCFEIWVWERKSGGEEKRFWFRA